MRAGAVTQTLVGLAPGAGAGKLNLMGRRADQDSRVQQLLDELCVRLGFCLPPEDNDRLCESPPANAAAFTDAVIAAEGMGDMSNTSLRRQVREVVDRHMSRWPVIT